MMVFSESMQFNQNTSDNLNPADTTVPILKKNDEIIRVREKTSVINKETIGHSFILSHTLNGVLGAPALGDDGQQVVLGQAGREATLLKVVNPNNLFTETFKVTTFEDTGNTTATWDTTNGHLTFSSTPIGEEAWYKLDSDGTDCTGNGHDGTASASVSFVAGKVGNAASFDGSSGSVFVHPSVDANNIWDGGGAISVWIKPTAAGEGSGGRIFIKPSGNALQLSSASASTAKLYFVQYFSVVSGEWITTGYTIPFGEWSHVVVNYNSSTTTTDPEIWVNAATVAVTESATPQGTRLSDATQAFFIGNNNVETGTFNGLIDDFRQFSGTTLGSSAISFLYNGGDGYAGSAAYPKVVQSGTVYLDTTLVDRVKFNASGTTSTTDDLTGVQFYASADGGATFTSCANNTLTVLSQSGTALKWKAVGTDGTITTLKIKY